MKIRHSNFETSDIQDRPLIDLVIKLPPNFGGASFPSLQGALQRAVDVAISAYSVDKKLMFDADKMAQLVIANASPTLELVEERTARQNTIAKILKGTKFLSGEIINDAQKNPKENKHAVASDWKRRGRIFSVLGNDGKEYYPAYQFDMAYQPLPVIKDILAEFAGRKEAWAIASWFHFPNGWLSDQINGETKAVAPKEALNRRDDLINAAKATRGTHFA